MSKFSGKCDLADTLIIHNYTEDELKNNVEIYVGNSDKPLKINKKEDLIPYYPYIIGCASYDNKTKTAIIKLSSESYVDLEEKEILNMWLKYILKIYNRCKRKKEEFKIQNVIQKMVYSSYVEQPITELADRVQKLGKKATIDNIHLPLKDWYRKELIKEMIENGLNPVDYGYDRLLKTN